MPVDVEIHIRPSGGDFTTLDDAVTNYSGNKDLVAADNCLKFIIHDEFGGYLDEGFGVKINDKGYTTNKSGNHIEIIAAAGDEQSYSESSGARITANDQYTVTIYGGSTYVVLRNIVIQNKHIAGGICNVWKAYNCYFVSEGNGIFHAIESYDSLYIGKGGPSESAAIRCTAYDPITLRRCAVINGYIDGGPPNLSTAEVNVYDTVIYNPGFSTLVNTNSKTVNADNNAFSDGAGFGTNKQLNIGTDQFTDFAGADYSTANPSTMYTNGIGIIPQSGDNEPPNYTSAPSITSTSSSGHTISATLNESGRVYAVRLPNGAAAPTSAQVKAGQDSTGSSAPEAKSSAATAATNVDLTFSTGNPSTAYDYYYTAEDDEATPNLRASATLVEGTTATTNQAITITGGDLEAGNTESGTYTNMTGVAATGTVTDSAGNQFSVTVTDGNDGTMTVAVPALPTSGTRNLGLFGDATLQIDEAP